MKTPQKTEGAFPGKHFIVRRCKWSQMKERPKMHVGHLSDFLFKGPVSLKIAKAVKKWQYVHTLFRENGALHGVVNGPK